ncbi:MAG: glycosyltransferase, partial [Burkholderiales bacterium]
MNIGFILPGAAISGGIYVVFEHATRLNRIFGHQVFIITESKVAPEEYAWHESAKELIWLSFDEAIGLKFNCLIATFWRTVYELPRLHADHYVYFAQSIESKFYPDEDQYVREWVDSTYALGLTTITEATWIKQYLNNNYAGQVFLVKNGIRKDLYTQDGNSIAKKDSNRLRVLVEGPLDIPFKNVKKTLKLCKASDADEVWLLTSSTTENDTLADKVFSKVPITKVPEIYRSCDVIVKLSYVEGMFGPPLEMFHCGGTAIVYNVTGHEEYIVNEHN